MSKPINFLPQNASGTSKCRLKASTHLRRRESWQSTAARALHQEHSPKNSQQQQRQGQNDGLSLQLWDRAEGRANEKMPCVVSPMNINKKLPLVKLARNKFPKGEFKAERFSLSLAFPRIHCSVLADVVMSQKRQTEQLLLRKTFGRYALELGFIGSLPSSPSDLLSRKRVFLI